MSVTNVGGLRLLQTLVWPTSGTNVGGLRLLQTLVAYVCTNVEGPRLLTYYI